MPCRVIRPFGHKQEVQAVDITFSDPTLPATMPFSVQDGLTTTITDLPARQPDVFSFHGDTFTTTNTFSDYAFGSHMGEPQTSCASDIIEIHSVSDTEVAAIVNQGVMNACKDQECDNNCQSKLKRP